MGWLRKALKPVKDVINPVTSALGINGRENADYQNSFTTEQLKLQRAWQLEDREYNSPANQMARFRAAGINPYMALGDINAGNASETSPSPVQGANPNNSEIGGLIKTGIDSFIQAPVASATSKNLKAQTELTKLQAKEKQIDLESRAERNQLELSKLRQDGRISREQYRSLMLDNKYRLDTYDDALRQFKFQTAESDARAKAQEAVAEQENLRIDFVNELVKSARTENEQSAQRFAMEIQEVASRINLNYASAKNQINQAAKALAEKYGIEYDTGLKKQVEDYVVRTHQAQTQEQESRAWVQKQTEGSQVENYKEGVKQNKFNTKILKRKSDQPLFPFIGLETTEPFSIPDIKLGRGASSRW